MLSILRRGALALAKRPAGIVGALVLGSLGAGGVAVAATDGGLKTDSRHVKRLMLSADGIARSSRAVGTFAMNSIDYKVSALANSLDKLKTEAPAEYARIRSEIHQRSADRILRLCEANRGIYIKAGQFIATLQQLPREYRTTLTVLQDQAKGRPFNVIDRVFKEEFGKSAKEIFVHFEEEAIAAASLAQVHRATLPSGQEVAVKVQYPRLEEQVATDIYTMGFLSRAVKWIFPNYQFSWIVPQFQENLQQQLDFEREGRNAELTAENFAHKEEVKVPKILWDFTTKRILTMEFMNGCKIDDLEGIKKQGLNPLEGLNPLGVCTSSPSCLPIALLCFHQVAALLVEVFAEMVFCHGHLHGSMPSAVLSLPTPLPPFPLPLCAGGGTTGGGVCRDGLLSRPPAWRPPPRQCAHSRTRTRHHQAWTAEVRYSFARSRALQGDGRWVQKGLLPAVALTHSVGHGGSAEMGREPGRGGVFTLPPCALHCPTFPKQNAVGAAHVTGGGEELEEGDQGHQPSGHDSGGGGLPKDMFLVMRTDNLIRQHITALGATPKLRLQINGRFAVAGLAVRHSEEGHLTSNLAAYLRAQLDLAHLMLRIRVWEVAQTIIDLVVRTPITLRSSAAGYSRSNPRPGDRSVKCSRISGSQRIQRIHGGQDKLVTHSGRGLEARSTVAEEPSVTQRISQRNDDGTSPDSRVFARHDCDNLGISAARVTDEASRRVQLDQNLFELLHQSNSFFASRSLLVAAASLTAAAALVFLHVDTAAAAAAAADATAAASAAISGDDAVAAAATWTNPLQQVVAAVEQGGDAAGPLGGAVYFAAAYAIAAVLLVPASILTLASGYLFGAARGTAITLIAATLGASVSFLIARYAARPFVARQLAGRLGEGRFEALDRAISVGGWRIVLLCRLSPIFPFSILNYVFGITGKI
ncbi:unnamed protein product [Closterium sp. Yama58-4]|nr:unnamed protein product [Closterium sp. Yama58-4]